MDMDAKMKRGLFIRRSLDVREAFGLASPTQVLGAINVLASNLYGGML